MCRVEASWEIWRREEADRICTTHKGTTCAPKSAIDQNACAIRTSAYLLKCREERTDIGIVAMLPEKLIDACLLV
jgi:hypothetical protein